MVENIAQEYWKIVMSYLDFADLQACELTCKALAKQVNYSVLFANKYETCIEPLYSRYLQVYAAIYKQYTILPVKKVNKLLLPQTLLHSSVNKFDIPYPRNAKRACYFLFSQGTKFSRRQTSKCYVPEYYMQKPHLVSEHVMLLACGEGNNIVIFDWSTNQTIAKYACDTRVQSVRLVHRPDLQQKLQKKHTIYSVVVASQNKVMHLVLIDNGTKCQFKLQHTEVTANDINVVDVRACLFNSVLHVVAVLDSLQLFFYQDMIFQFQFNIHTKLMATDKQVFASYPAEDGDQFTQARFFPFTNLNDGTTCFFVECMAADLPFWHSYFIIGSTVYPGIESVWEQCTVASPHGIHGYGVSHRNAMYFTKFASIIERYQVSYTFCEATCSDNHMYYLHDNYNYNEHGWSLSVDKQEQVNTIDCNVDRIFPGEWFCLIGSELYY